MWHPSVQPQSGHSRHPYFKKARGPHLPFGKNPGPVQKPSLDGILLVLILILVVYGLLLLHSTSAYNGRVKFHDVAYYTKKQAFATILGLFLLLFVSKIDYHICLRLAPYAYLVSLLLSLAVLFIGDSYNGSRRWLSLGPLSFQPSEFAKPAVILFLTWLTEHTRQKVTTIRFMLFILTAILPIVGLVGSNNLSTAIILLGIGVITIFVSNPRYLPFLGIGVVGIAFVSAFLSLESYRLERIRIWQNPELYEKGFQTIQGLYAIATGGLFGSGFGNSLQKLGFVPEAQNDMIFSIICEETGLAGACILLLLFLLLLWRLMIIAIHATDLAGALIASGIMSHLAIQVLLNIAVVTNTIPNTGITLPFISYGGTSILFLLSEMGLALSISRSSN